MLIRASVIVTNIVVGVGVIVVVAVVVAVTVAGEEPSIALT